MLTMIFMIVRLDYKQTCQTFDFYYVDVNVDFILWNVRGY